jgi:DNA-binding ferritin-like protein (Dps family)
MSKIEKIIIGYFHICQTTHWERSFDFIMNEIKSSGLYDATTEIRCGIVNNNGNIIYNERFNDPKLKLVVYASSADYERPTILHMRHYSNTDPSNTVYWYAHTKGLRHYGTIIEKNVVDWIILLLYWNISHWRLAVNMLNYYESYGCNAVGNTHYSGNFWWATATYINTLPSSIGSDYVAPEFWICSREHKMCNIYTNELAGGGNYGHPLDISVYKIPENFDIGVYKYFNNLDNMQYHELILHYLNNGKNENRIYTLPKWFDISFYRNEYNMEIFKDEEIIHHWVKYGQYQKYRYNELIPVRFDEYVYRICNPDISNLNIYDLITHYIENGRNESRTYCLPEKFDFNYYRITSNLLDCTNEEIILHWANHGQYENRSYCLPDKFNFNYYRIASNLLDFSNEEIMLHWINHGQHENRIYCLPDEFNFDYYRLSPDISHFTDEEVMLHWINHGQYEGRKYCEEMVNK